LDTLFLASPISFEGRLVQYVGRLHRGAAGKTVVEVFDYAEVACAVSLKMWRGQLRTHQKLGYTVHEPDEWMAGNRPSQSNLFEV